MYSICYTFEMRQLQEEKLESIPGVGKRVAKDLRDLGIKKPEDLKGKNPETLYAKLEKLRGVHEDRCLLYTFRCAVYYAEGGRDTDKLKWWNWKDIKRTF